MGTCHKKISVLFRLFPMDDQGPTKYPICKFSLRLRKSDLFKSCTKFAESFQWKKDPTVMMISVISREKCGPATRKFLFYLDFLPMDDQGTTKYLICKFSLRLRKSDLFNFCTKIAKSFQWKRIQLRWWFQWSLGKIAVLPRENFCLI